MNIAGNNTTCGALVITDCPAVSIEPIDERVALSRFTTPRYESEVSLNITPGITSTEPVMSVPRELGNMCLNIILASLAPRVLAARTYS